jgi:hypothetical protein
MKLQVDLDGDGSAELVTFWFAVDSYRLTVMKHGSTFALPLKSRTLENARLVHLAVKDVTNDGLPEILLAVSDGPGSLGLYVWGLSLTLPVSAGSPTSRKNAIRAPRMPSRVFALPWFRACDPFFTVQLTSLFRK